MAMTLLWASLERGTVSPSLAWIPQRLSCSSRLANSRQAKIYDLRSSGECPKACGIEAKAGRTGCDHCADSVESLIKSSSISGSRREEQTGFSSARPRRKVRGFKGRRVIRCQRYEVARAVWPSNWWYKSFIELDGSCFFDRSLILRGWIAFQ